MKKSESIVELAKALNKFQKELRPAKKTSENPFFKSTYADLAAIWEAIREPLTKHGLAIVQTMDYSEAGTPLIETVLCHTSGEWIGGALPVKPVKDDPQSLGSAITYARRYSLSAMLGLVTEEDDDGEKAMGREEKSPPSRKADPEMKITDKQVKLVWAKAYAIFADKDIAHQAVRDILKRYGVESTKDMTQAHLDDFLEYIERVDVAQKPDEGLPF